jgi:3-oxoacyl-[acyl-carrier protein] reductase
MNMGSTNNNSKVAVVSGGAQGLGREVCLQLAALRWNVVVADINGDDGQTTVEDCRKLGVESLFVEVDLGSESGPVQMIEKTVQRFARIDVLINCAAYAKAEQFSEMRASTWQQMLLVNVRGIALAMVAAAKPMSAQGGGRIINITSPASRMALPHYAAYAASKAAVDSLTRSAAVALAKDNIQVNSVSPGMMDTPMQSQTEADLAAIEGRDDVGVFLAERTARIPIGRRATCQEIAEVVVWLATAAPDYVTAERFNASGGLDKD